MQRGQRMRRGSPRSGSGREQLGRHVGGIAQLAQLVAGQAKHGAVRFAVDVVGDRRVSLQAVGVADARCLRVPSPVLVGEEQRSRTFRVVGLVGVALAARLFPTEQDAADELGKRGLAGLVATEHHVHARPERPDQAVGERAERVHLDMFQIFTH